MGTRRSTAVTDAFDELWNELFSSPVHLDSALSKRSKNMKTTLAQIVSPILRAPVALAAELGVGVSPGEPWGLPRERLKEWRPARLIADRLYATLSSGVPRIGASEDDYPPIFRDSWKSDWGAEASRSLARALALEPPLSLRVNGRIGPDDFVKRLRSEASLPVSVARSRLSPRGIVLGGYAPILHTPLYEDGAFEIQDEGSQLMSYFALWPEVFAGALTPAPGAAPSAWAPPAELPAVGASLTVIDACAGAGGKTLAIADALRGRGRVYAYDTSEKKLAALKRRAKRAGQTNVQAVAVQEGKEEQLVAKFQESANLVLVDAPCSGWGVLRRNPDIKWRQDPSVLERMPELQLRLLSAYSGLVAPGGRLVYGVCTFRRAETEELVSRFLASHPDFEAHEGGFAGPGSSDGFFMRNLVRRRA